MVIQKGKNKTKQNVWMHRVKCKRGSWDGVGFVPAHALISHRTSLSLH